LFNVLQRKPLQPNHFKILEELAQAILSFISCQNRTAIPIRWTFTVMAEARARFLMTTEYSGRGSG
jgi:hypothetical protein